MITIDPSKHQKIHTRNIEIACYVNDEASIIVEGRLQDERLIPTYRSSSDRRPPGPVHHMIIRMTVRGPGLVIEDVHVEMPTTPHEDCIEMQKSLLPAIGLPIVSGFSARIRDLVGGKKGCTHLVALLTAMAPMAVQGAWSAATRKPEDLSILMEEAMNRIKDTCYAWRSDGPLYQRRQHGTTNGN